MKLDRIRFALLIGYIADMANRTIDFNEIVSIDTLTEINVEPVATQYVEAEKIDELLRCMQERHYGSLISAIKAYRVLTGVGLKEAKDAIEKYSYVKGYWQGNLTLPTSLGGA